MTTIYLKYSIGDKVWFMNGSKVDSHKIMAYRASSSKDGIEYAVLKHNVGCIHNPLDIRYGYLKESKIFSTKEQLLKSL